MSLYIGGIQAIGAHGASLKAERTSQTAIEKLATGKQLERAGENAAGVGSSQRMAADMVGLNQATSNIASAGDMLSVVDGSLSSVSDLLLRARELSVQFGNSTLDGTQKRMIEDEVKHLLNEINAVTQRARFGDRALLDGNFKDQVIRDNGLNDSNIQIGFPKISTTELGSHTYYASGAIATSAATSPAANPVTTDEDITIKGYLGSKTFEAIAQESAKDLASRISLDKDDTGVDASAMTEAVFRSSSTSPEVIKLTINGTETPTFDISRDDVREAVNAINSITELTGVRASAIQKMGSLYAKSGSADFPGVRLTDHNGDDITIENASTSTNLRINKISASGDSHHGPRQALGASGSSDSVTITGTLTLHSTHSFGIGEAGNSATESIIIQTDDNISTEVGVVSISSDGDIYVGNGQGGSDSIGNIDTTMNGQNGQPLKINIGQFGNNDFETGSNGDTTISGWSISNQQIKLNGVSNLGGKPTASDTSFPATVAGGSAAPHDGMTPSSANYSTTLSNETSSGSGLSVKLLSNGVQFAGGDGYGILHGPAIVSDSSVKLDIGDTVSFEWKAEGGADSYDVIGYLVDESTGNIEEILNDTGADAGADTNWATVNKTISTAGTYKFVFVSGTWDATGGLAAGAQLYIDNINVTQNNKAPLADDIIAQIQSAVSSSRNGYLQPVDVISTGDELRFTVAESNVSQFVALETLDLSGFDGQRKAEQLILNSLSQVHGERSSIGAQKNRLFQSSLSIMDISGAMENAKSRVTDADFALESAKYFKAKTLQETSTKILATVNDVPKSVLDLLKREAL